MILSSGGGWTSLKLFLSLPEVLVEVGQSTVYEYPCPPLFAIEGEQAVVFDDGDTGPDGACWGGGVAPPPSREKNALLNLAEHQFNGSGG